jgi:hypothetical protein
MTPLENLPMTRRCFSKPVRRKIDPETGLPLLDP